MSLEETFSALPRPTAESRYTVERTAKRFRVGRSFENFPALLVAFPAGGSADSLPRRLANLTYRPPSTVDVMNESFERSERLAVLECRTGDPLLVSYFFRVVAAVLLQQEIAESESAFEVALDAIVTLFRALQQPAQRSVQGLWAELAVVSWSKNASAALASWHTSPRALHDFSAGGFRLEVKSASHGLREHKLLLDQLGSIEPGATLLVSLLLDESPSGSSIFDLVEGIKRRVANKELDRRLELIVAESLGANWPEASELRFDVALARQRVRVYSASAIPSVPQPIPPEVKDVSFTVDLSTTSPLEFPAARSIGAFFDDLLPE